MNSESKAHYPDRKPDVGDAIARYHHHDNPFGKHPDGIGPTLGEDVAEDLPPEDPPRVK